MTDLSMSPFVITTKRPCPEGHEEPMQQGDGGGWDGNAYHTPPCEICGDYCEIVVSRRAVATLEGESDIACQRCAYCLAGEECRFGYVLAKMPASGGTVGPLPDGTVIEVEPIEWTELASDDRRSAKWAERGLFGAQNRIITDYNAREATTWPT